MLIKLAPLKVWAKTSLTDTVIDFGNKSLLEKLFFIKESADMFAFFTDIKNRIAALEAKVEALFKSKEQVIASIATPVEAEVAKVEEVVTAVKAAE